MRPIFVGGAARSGTTVFAARLGERLGYAVLPEAYFLAPSVLNSFAGGSFTGLQPSWRLRTWELSDADFAWIQSARSVSQAWSRALSARGVADTDPWIEHSPHNLRYCGSLLKAFPDAKFVHLVRDGRAVGASLRRTDFGPYTSAAIARWWTESVAVGLAAHRAFPNQVRQVTFEHFLTEPDRVLDDLVKSFGLQTRGAPEVKPSSFVHSYTRQHHRLVDGELRTDRLDGWQADVSPRWVKRFEQIAGPLLEGFGYRLHYPAQVAPTQVARVLDPILDGAIQLGLKAPRRRFRRWKYAR
ncbi:sulfotransferase family protein [Mycolicibacterium sp. XJ647]